VKRLISSGWRPTSPDDVGGMPWPDGSSTTRDREAVDPPERPHVADTLRRSRGGAVDPAAPAHADAVDVPGLGVYASAGLLPRKRLERVRSWTTTPLARVMPWFRMGPVSLEPGAVRLPRVSALPTAQESSHRDTPTSWRHDPIQGATATARLPDEPATIHEGWTRARQA
jgi:hypothetical protein